MAKIINGKKKIGSNMYEMEKDGVVILYSYDTPVACKTFVGSFRTSQKWSSTTTRHINKWLTEKAEEKPQEYFNELVA